ncbi:unnamed protein product [Prunus armeniaca]
MSQDKVLKGMLVCHRVVAEWHTCISQGEVPKDKKGYANGAKDSCDLRSRTMQNLPGPRRQASQPPPCRKARPMPNLPGLQANPTSQLP